MENTQANRNLIARMTMESYTFQELEEALIYELCERYKREPGLLSALAVEFEAIEAETEAIAIEHEQRGDYVPTPDVPDLLMDPIEDAAKHDHEVIGEGAKIYGPCSKDEADAFVDGAEYANDSALVVKTATFVYRRPIGQDDKGGE